MAHDPADVLSPSQTLVIWALLAKQGFAAQNDLGITVDASDRADLERREFVSTLKREQNALWLRLEEAGWAWAEEHLTKALPPGQTVLHNLMVRLDAHIKAKGERLIDVIGTSPKAGPLDPEMTGVVDA